MLPWVILFYLRLDQHWPFLADFLGSLVDSDATPFENFLLPLYNILYRPLHTFRLDIVKWRRKFHIHISIDNTNGIVLIFGDNL